MFVCRWCDGHYDRCEAIRPDRKCCPDCTHHHRPQRIQRRRTKGWRMPAGARYVGRPTMFGNLWKVVPTPPPRQCGDDWTLAGPGMFFCYTDELYDAHEFAVTLYREWLTYDLEATALRLARGELAIDLAKRRGRILGQLGILADRDLACWCPLDLPCHADVLLELANGEAE